MVEILPYLEKVKQKASEEGIKKEFEGFNKTVLFEFQDLGKKYVLKFEAGKADVFEGSVEKPDIVITTSSDVLAGILDKKTNPVMAYVSRKIKVKGEMQDLLKLQKLLG